MKRAVNIAVVVAGWAVLLAYLLFASWYCSRRTQEVVCRGIDVRVVDSAELGFITPEVVRNILVSDNIKITGEKISSLNTAEVERSLLKRGYIKSARVYTSIDGRMNIEIVQRRPIMRIQSENGYGIYISEDGYALPLQSYFHPDVPVVTGFPPLPFPAGYSGELPQGDEAEKKYGENYRFIHNLINFVRFTEDDPFWNSQIVQINVLRNGDVELVQRVGEYVVNMGGLDDYREKLEKLLVFYRKALVYEGWNTYRYIDIAYKGQVYCTR